ncbi:EAL domain-containing protein [Thiomicrorhabdus arctica]|uniref:EAL domain-containing protein n=1 Tax=Thiomicrorhabdus arctica TaxID=131540 RepID=UPI00035D4003|nr:EAL domain-containing protein [Thiomicrorhabdus arctica]
MSLFHRFKTKLSYKLHIPIIFVFILGLVTVTLNAVHSIQKLTQEKHLEVQDTYQHYAKKALQTQYQIALTNVIAIANNSEIQQALFEKDRPTAQILLNKLLEQYTAYTDFHNIKIHLHTLDLHSFLRSWRPDNNGDDLSPFRYSLHQLQKTQKPFATIELGRAGILLRGLSPIKYQGKIIGSVEFIQSFDSIIGELKHEHQLKSLVLSPYDKTINYFNSPIMVGSQYVLLNGNLNTNQKIIQSLTDKDFGVLENKKPITKAGLYLTGIPLVDFSNKRIGWFLVADSLANVDNIIDHAQQALLFQIIIMLIIDLLIILLLVWILHKSIVQPISKLSTHIANLNTVIDDLDKLKQADSFKNHREDEIGTISKALDRFIKHINHLLQNLQKSNKINTEYLKAVDAGSIVSKATPTGIITYVNQALCDATGYSETELIGQPHNMLRHPSTPKSTFRELWRTITHGNIWHGLFKNKRKDGSSFYANITVAPIMDENGNIIEYLALRDDVTELVMSQKKLRKAFSTDTLTSLGNRFKLMDDFTPLEKAYLAIIDIRSFKEINDFYGYELGDKVIVELGNCIFDYFEEKGYEVYRLQGDEFAVLANGALITEEDFIEKVKNLPTLLDSNPFTIDDYTPEIDLTLGISTNIKDLFTEADIAHNTAKKLNKNFLKYSKRLKTSDEYKNNLLWTGHVKKALAQGRILSYYQPIVNNVSRKVEKYEALVRMATEGKKDKIISPFFFLEISKKARLYSKITETMIENSFRYFANRSEQISINLTADDIVNDEVVEYLILMLDKYNIGERVVLEIVESEGIQNFEEVEHFIRRLKEKGCKIAVDDFGTGYSNFEFLLKLKPDFLKIDGSMIKNIHLDPHVYNVVEIIVAFAKKNGIKTIAEFVSEEVIFDIVTDLGIDYSQGYYFGEPKASALPA